MTGKKVMVVLSTIILLSIITKDSKSDSWPACESIIGSGFARIYDDRGTSPSVLGTDRFIGNFNIDNTVFPIITEGTWSHTTENGTRILLDNIISVTCNLGNMTEFWGTGEVNEEPGWHITVTILGPEDDVLAYCPATSYGIVACAPEEICSTDYTINRFGWITRGTVNVRP